MGAESLWLNTHYVHFYSEIVLEIEAICAYRGEHLKREKARFKQHSSVVKLARVLRCLLILLLSF